MTNMHKLKENLAKGFYLDNLYEMASICLNLAMDIDYPLPFYLLNKVFLDIARDWEDRPLAVEEAKLVESHLKKPIEDVIAAVERAALPEELLKLLNDVVSAYLVSFR